MQSDTVRVIWAIHDVDPSASGELHFHGGHRGEQSLYLLGPPTVSYPPATRHWDITLKNVSHKMTPDSFYDVINSLSTFNEELRMEVFFYIYFYV